MTLKYRKLQRFRMVNGVVQKLCNGCNTWKSLDEYYPRYNRPSQVKSRCKRCYNSTMALRRTGVATNNGYIKFKDIKEPLKILLHNADDRKHAARLAGISVSQIYKYISAPPKSVKRGTAAKIFMAATQARKERSSGT